MKRIFYEKVGNRYKPVSEYDYELFNSFHKGNHLVMCYPGGTSYRYNIDPDYAAMIAAGRVAEEPIVESIRKSMEPRHTQTELTPEQRELWKKFSDSMGDHFAVTVPAAYDAAKAGVEAMQKEADKLLENPAVRKAYDHFMLVCELTKKRG